MNYHQEWINLIQIRDSYYLMAFLVMATGTFWFVVLRRRIRRIIDLAMAVVVLMVAAAWLWGTLLLWPA